MAHDTSDTNKMFKLIANEIITKQNGLDMSDDDLSTISSMYLDAGGNAQQLVAGVMAEFDTLKDAIVKHYEESEAPEVVSASVVAASKSVRQKLIAARVSTRDLIGR